MRRCLMGTARCKAQTVCYYLLVEELESGTEAYGVSVECGGEREARRRLTVSGRSVLGLIRRLIQGGVTPVALGDVVEDWLLR
ncbi:DUF6514 family protein [uncultured Oscillibacter sp.]|uniref:DUF6514 family protein n=2 Tax=uncultured Oscillibacter sp. TaxID=876091 RepID=UPI00280525D7|nr:DUF6514 family protein [uncultured Oscillibacter sp.]